MSKKLCFIGLDVGTSGAKALAVTPEGRILGRGSALYPMATPKPGWAEQHPDLWWKGSCKALRQAAMAAKKAGAQIRGLGLSGQMHSSVFLDASDRVIRPALLWCDGRTTEECRIITRAWTEKVMAGTVGNAAFEGFTAPKVLWLKRREPGSFRKLRTLMLAKDYVRLRLTGEKVTDFSDAAGTLMWDVHRNAWASPLLEKIGVNPSILPPAVGSHEDSGRVSPSGADATGIPAGTVVAGGGADNPVAAVGVGAVREGEALISLGTSGVAFAPTNRLRVDPKLSAHAFNHTVPDMYYLMGVMLSAGGSLRWYRDVLRGGTYDQITGEASRIPPGAEGLFFQPYLQGERTPLRDSSARASFTGLSGAHGKAHLSRAVLEGITFGLKDCLDLVLSLKVPLKNLTATGGGARSRFWLQLQADVFGLPVRTVAVDEGPAFGAAILASVAAGHFRSVPEASDAAVRKGPVIRPLPSRTLEYAAIYRDFKKIYPALRGL